MQFALLELSGMSFVAALACINFIAAQQSPPLLC